LRIRTARWLLETGKRAGMSQWLSPNRVAMSVVVTGLAALCLAALVLRARHDHVRASRVQAHLARGHELVAHQQPESAAAQFRAALALDRDNPQAARALAVTLLSLGRVAESESHLRELLRQAPTDGELNRDLARIHAARGDAAGARTAYQRAIYGEWTGDGVSHRTDTRFEFVEFLTRIGARQEVLAELLRLRAELPPGHTASARRAADLLAEVGAADLAREMLQTAALTAPRDVDLLAHLADFEASTGQPGNARSTLRRAVDIAPGRRDLSDRLLVIDRVLALDPTLPRLGLVARTRRARMLLAQVLDVTTACPEGAGGLQDLRKAAAVRIRRRARADAEAAEEDLTLAKEIWTAAAACHATTPDARAVSQVLQRLGVPPDTGS
jgi:tetratricopeptide (TPR) repeat protein